jgi:DNA-binding response OmpR family regulator
MPKTKKKIIIIDDEKPLARALELKLLHVGFEISIAENGEEGLAILEKENFSLILLDLIMPKMDGFLVLEALKNKGNKTPVIVLSNLSQTEDEKRAKLLGAKAFFVKSDTQIAVIVEKVIEFLN